MHQTFTEQRNAPNINNRLSLIVDATQAAVDDARAVGMHDVAGIALRFWQSEGGNR